MDLYDDIDTKPRTSQIDGWSSGIKMLQTQLAIKKAQLPKAKELPKKPLMTPVVNLRAQKLAEEANAHKTDLITNIKPVITAKPLAPVLENVKTDEYWNFIDEYDPQWPNEYEKLKEKDKKEKTRETRTERLERSDRKRSRARSSHNDSPPVKLSGFGQRTPEEDSFSPPAPGSNKGGVAIAPPPCIQEISLDSGEGGSSVTIPYSASSVAAKIMAKYGFKDGQGLGKQEQGMSMALQVEKTSKRGGRIIHEKDVLIQPPTPSTTDNFVLPSAPISMPPPPNPAPPTEPNPTEPSITEIMKQPSKVVLLKNMVGPGDVDDELEPEVKDECNTKYGEVVRVVIHESTNVNHEDAVKIFVEFKRIESAIKAVVDLNGRFFGGRQVKAMFYNYDKFQIQQFR